MTHVGDGVMPVAPGARWPKWTVVLVLSAAVFSCDQATKRAVRDKVPYLDRRPVISCCLNLTHVWNRGGAFGMFSDSESRWGRGLFSGASFLALGFLAYLIVVAPARAWFQIVQLAAILGGALGNLWDRMREGHVVDFIDAHVNNWHWPSFNVADTAITLGIIGILGEMLIRSHKPSPPPSHFQSATGGEG